MCMGNTTILKTFYAMTGDGLGLVPVVRSADFVLGEMECNNYAKRWEEKFATSWSGDFYCADDGILLIYTEGPPEAGADMREFIAHGSPVKWVVIPQAGSYSVEG